MFLKKINLKYWKKVGVSLFIFFSGLGLIDVLSGGNVGCELFYLIGFGCTMILQMASKSGD